MKKPTPKKYPTAHSTPKVEDNPVTYLSAQYSNQSSHTLLQVIRTGIDYAEFFRIKERSGLSLSDWANYLNLSERTLLRYSKSDEHLDKGTTERIIEIAILQERAVQVFGNLDTFNQWLNSPVRALGNAYPKDYLDSTIGIQILMDLLGRIEHGIPS